MNNAKLSVVCLLLLISTYALGETNRFYILPKIEKDMEINGKIDEEAWKNAPWANGFLNFSTHKISSTRTCFKAVYDEQNLYLGIKAEDADIISLQESAMNDSVSICSDDGFEIFIFPENNDTYHHFMVNSAGSRWNGTGMGNAYPLGKWKAAISKGKDFYVMEIAIPWEEFGIIPEISSCWKANIFRNSISSGDRYTTWADVRSTAHDTDNFGLFFFGSKKIDTDETKKIIKQYVFQKIAKIVPLYPQYQYVLSEAAQKAEFRDESLKIIQCWEKLLMFADKQEYRNNLEYKELFCLLEEHLSILKNSEDLKYRYLLTQLIE